MNTRPDTCFVVNDLSQFLTDPRHAHLVPKHVVRYLKGTFEYGIKYDMMIQIGSATKKKSTLGCFFSFRSSMGY